MISTHMEFRLYLAAVSRNIVMRGSVARDTSSAVLVLAVCGLWFLAVLGLCCGPQAFSG